jgi:hypothetical protein
MASSRKRKWPNLSMSWWLKKNNNNSQIKILSKTKINKKRKITNKEMTMKKVKMMLVNLKKKLQMNNQLPKTNL